MDTTTTKLELISFTNGLASIKPGATIDIARLRDTKVYAKLMLNKDTKYVDKEFLYSESGTFIRAELFIVAKSGNIVTDNRLYVNVDPTKSKLLTDGHMWFVELEHPKLDLSECEEVPW